MNATISSRRSRRPPPEGADQRALAPALLVASSVLLVGGVVAHLLGAGNSADLWWTLATVLGIVPCAWWIWLRARQHAMSADVVALLALVGTLVVGEHLAGAVITLMLLTGRTLEERATARARRELRSLRSHVPRTVRVIVDGSLRSPSIDDVVPGDLLLVEPGEVVPVDGRVVEVAAVLDESALTGESLPVERLPDEEVRSGALNAGNAIRVRATRRAADSTYAGVVQLATEAESEAASAPFVRLADRYAAVFLAVSLLAAGLAWLVSGDPVRAVAVLVVATPCPLILATPIAFTAGLSRAASRGVLMRGGAALERLAGARVLLLDKTGTLTAGRPALADVLVVDETAPQELLRLAASLDQVSSHVLAGAIVAAARERRCTLSLPSDVEEVPGSGVRGLVDGHRVAVGKSTWVSPTADPGWTRAIRRRADLDGSMTVFVAIDCRPAGGLLLDDPVRPDAARTIRTLRGHGVERVVMLTGDRADVAESVGLLLGVDAVLAERGPADKVADVVAALSPGRTVVMVGDGINDAPALARADVGVALSTGSMASSEAADVVLGGGRLGRLAEAIDIAQRTRRIARQSALFGVGASVVAMAFAMGGLLVPAAGALLQEGIDVAVIVNALRALRGRGPTSSVGPADTAIAVRFAAQHDTLRPELDRLRVAADRLADPSADSIATVREVQRFLVEQLAPHEDAEGAQLYPVMDRLYGNTEATATMTRAHYEVARLIRRLGRVLDQLDDAAADDNDVLELRRLLYGLHAILELHFAQEDEAFLSVLDEPADASTA